jgi:hypothetical protein
MKKLIIVLVVVLTFVGCQKDDEVTVQESLVSNIVGTWQPFKVIQGLPGEPGSTTTAVTGCVSLDRRVYSADGILIKKYFINRNSCTDYRETEYTYEIFGETTPTIRVISVLNPNYDTREYEMEIIGDELRLHQTTGGGHYYYRKVD